MEGQAIYAETLGLVTAEVYPTEAGKYCLVLLGDSLACFIGTFGSLADCQEEIQCLRRLEGSEDFQQAAARQR